MQLFLIPGPPNKNTFSYVYTVNINGSLLKFHFLYNSRLDTWSISILTIEDEILVNNIVLRKGTDLLSQYKHIEALKNVILVVYSENTPEDPNESNFGKTSFLGYIGES